jgi:hypothetical protein
MKDVMDLIGKRVRAVSDHGTYKGREVTGTLIYNMTTDQFIVKINKIQVSVDESTIQLIK